MISIIDYGLGNIKAFQNVYERLNIPIKISRNSKDLLKTSKIILPGVGSFDHAMNLLNKSGMREEIEKLVLIDKVPVLGACVGMQILAKSSEEGKSPGLGWLDAEVLKFDISKIKYKSKLPHMGWNNVSVKDHSNLFRELSQELRYYFLHSYYFSINSNCSEIASSEYGHRFTCAIRSNNIYGVQFHPEKSHSNGINLLKNFAKL